MKKTASFAAVMIIAGSTISINATGSASAATCAVPSTGYGQMFPNLPSATFDSASLKTLSQQIMALPENNPTPEGIVDAEENLDIPAGYTYFGQFVDHDLTKDERPNDLTTPTPIANLINLRTPQLDLDSLYLSGPTTSPQLYNADGMHLLTGLPLSNSPDANAMDLPRGSSGQAIIGDGRNDENRIVAGVHSLFIRLHNQTVDRVVAQNPQMNSTQVFTAARQQVVAEYQRIIIDDFLPRIVGKRTMDSVLKVRNGKMTSRVKFYNSCAQMPVEFSVAAYRFGHSMVRGLYRLNSSVDRLPVFSGSFGTPGVDLVGFSPAPSNFGIDWSLFLPGGKSSGGIVQSSYKTDASITNSLSLLPLPVSSAGPADLGLRNLLRSSQLGLPSGQDVARAMGIQPLRDDQILVGKATGDAVDAVAINTISPAFIGKAPLWVYVLAESTATAYTVRDGAIVGKQRAPFRLGPVGGRIVAETFVGLLASDPNSILNTVSTQRRTDTRRPSSIKALFDRVERDSVIRTVRPTADAPRMSPAVRLSNSITQCNMLAIRSQYVLHNKNSPQFCR